MNRKTSKTLKEELRAWEANAEKLLARFSSLELSETLSAYKHLIYSTDGLITILSTQDNWAANGNFWTLEHQDALEEHLIWLNQFKNKCLAQANLKPNTSGAN